MIGDVVTYAASRPAGSGGQSGVVVAVVLAAAGLVLLWRFVLFLVAVGFVTLVLLGSLTMGGMVGDGVGPPSTTPPSVVVVPGADGPR